MSGIQPPECSKLALFEKRQWHHNLLTQHHHHFFLVFLCVWNPASRLLQIGHKSEKWQWHHNLLKNFWCCCVSLVMFSYWSKFHVSIITGSGVMTIYFIRDWPQVWKSEICLSKFCVISGGWSKLGIPNVAQMSNEMLLNAAECQSYSLCCFWVVKGKPTGGIK